ncbi:rnhA, partial [Mucuna pruriens]
MWFDEASNLLGNNIGAVLASPTDQCFPFSTRLGFDCTNNMAEYEACTMGITMALEQQVQKLRVFGDSSLVIYQLKGEWETRDPKLISYHEHIMELLIAFERHVPWEENQMADALATLAAMVQGTYPLDATKNDKRTLQRLASSFFLVGGTLYKRNSDMTLLRCVDEKEAQGILEEVHEGEFGTYANGHSLARKILRAGYY